MAAISHHRRCCAFSRSQVEQHLSHARLAAHGVRFLGGLYAIDALAVSACCCISASLLWLS
jgi:hypothetical protein